MAPKSKAKPAKASTSQSPPLQCPNWPPLTPLVPALDLTVDTVLKDQILVIANFFTSTLCKNYVAFLSSLPLITTPGKPKRGEAVRFNDRFQIEDATFADRLWNQTGLKEIVSTYEDPSIWNGKVLGLNPNIRVYRYRQGQFFDKHVSLSMSPSDSSDLGQPYCQRM